VFNGFDEGGGGWAETSLVEEFDGVSNSSGGKNTVSVTWFVLVLVRRVAKLDAPKAGSLFTISSQDRLVIQFDGDVLFGEVDFTVAIAE
jgi:hypothetical protein